jgi:hypothetical protein
MAIKADGSGNRYVTGYFSGTADFDPGAGTANLTATLYNDIFLAKYNASGNYVWAIRIGSGVTDNYGTALALDGSGNVLLTGYFRGTVDFNPGVGTADLVSPDGTDIFLAKYDASGNYVWAKGMGGTGNDIGTALALDGSGNVLLTGYFSVTADFDPGTTATANLESAGEFDIFLAKYDASGNYVWAKGMGGTGNDWGNALALDGSDNVLLTGFFNRTADFDPGGGTANLTSSGNTDIFLAKFDASGNPVWAKGMGGADQDDGLSLALDGSGNVLLTGIFNGTVDFDPGVGTAELTSSGNNDIYLAKFDASGNHVWAKGMGGADLDYGSSLALDGSGNVLLTGYFTGTVDFDPGVGTTNLISAATSYASSNDIFLAKFDASGNYVWAKSIGGAGEDHGLALALDGSGNVLLAGRFNNNVDFDPGVGIQNRSAASTLGNGFFASYTSASGVFVSVGALFSGSATNVVSQSITRDGSGNVYVTGYFSGTVDFDPGVGTANLTVEGSSDIFLAKYDASGNYVWANRMGGTDADRGLYLAMDGSGNVLLTGYFSGTVDFDPGAGTANLTSAGGNDIFLAKYNASGSYVWAKAMGGTGTDQGLSLALDGSGNVLLTGYFRNTVDFNPSTTVAADLMSTGNDDIFLAKYDASGNYVWANSMGGASGTDRGLSLALDGSGNVLLTGYFSGTAAIDFNPGADTANLRGAGGNDIFLAKYDASGNYVWAKRMGGTGADQGLSLAVDGSGNVLLTGYFNRTVDFNPGTTPTANLTSSGSGDDIFLAKYDASGNYVWANSMGGASGTDRGLSLALDGSGNVQLTGYFTGMADFDPSTTLTADLTSAGGNDIFLAKYNASGSYVWAKRMGGTGTDQGLSLAPDGSGNVLLTGIFRNTVDFDPGDDITELISMSGAQYGFFAFYAIPSCTNPTSGGTIAAAQSGASGFDPAAFTSSAAASGNSGTLEYKWQLSTTSNSTGFSDISGATSATYDPGSLTQTTWYKRLARVSCNSVWTGAAESNVLEVTVVSSVTWNGSVSTDWNTAANWTPSGVPSSTSVVVIPPGTTNAPAFPATATLAQLTVQSGTTMALGTGILTLTGNLTNNGTITVSTGKLSLAGSSAQTISGTGTIGILEINNSSGVTITSGAGNMQSITGTLAPTAGTLTTNGNLTLKSDATGTARVASLPASGAAISGLVTLERYLPLGRKWRMVTAPLTGITNNSVFYNWQNNDVVSAGRGVEIWGTGGDADPSGSNSGMAIGGGASMRSYGSSGWANVTNTNSTLLFDGTTNYGFALFAAGPYNNGSSAINPATAAQTTVLSATGNLITGDHTKSFTATAANQFFLVGNPYASPVDPRSFTATGTVNRTNLNSKLWMWDAKPGIGTGNGLGRYVSFDLSLNSYNVTGNGFADNNVMIQSGQAFFVQSAGSGAATLVFRESSKDANGSHAMMGDENRTPKALLRLTLQQPITGDSTENLDGAVAVFHAEGKPGLDPLDGSKLMNSSENIFFRREERSLTFEHRPMVTATDTLQLRMSNLQARSYRLQAEGSDFPDTDAVSAELIDRFTGRTVALSLTGRTDHPFTVTADSLSTGDRFLVVFRRAAAPVVVTPDRDGNGAGLKLYPNPVRNDLQVSVSVSMTGPYTVQVVSGSGEPVWMRTDIASGTKRVEINTSGMVSGVYHLVLTDAQGGRTVKKFVKE